MYRTFILNDDSKKFRHCRKKHPIAKRGGQKITLYRQNGFIYSLKLVITSNKGIHVFFSGRDINC